ncbi:MAG: hypothetical protein ABIO02_01645, partial [Patescibacteria group bacterium]
MGRKKKSKVKINGKTLFNVMGIMVAVIGIIFLLSFFGFLQDGNGEGMMLQTINEELINKFGFLGIVVPFLIIFISGHFFNTKKVTIVKPNITVGLLLLYISLLGFFHAGYWGGMIATNLAADFSIVGMIIVLSVCFVIGTILILDTSIESFVLFLVNMFKAVIGVFKGRVFSPNTGEKKKDKKSEEFIMDHGK